MAKFEVDFSEAFRQLAAFQSRLETMGNALDKLQKDADKPNLAAKKLIKDVTSNMVALEGSLKGYASDMKATLDALDRSSNTAISQLGKIAAANLRLTSSADAYLGKNKELERLLADTSAKSAFVRWTEKTRNLTNELAGENKYLSAQIKALSTEEGRTNLIRRATLASQSKQLTAAHQMALANKELKQQEELLGAMYGKSNAVLRARIAETVKAFQEETKLTGKLAEHQRAEESLTSGIRRQIVAQVERNKGIEQAITFEQRERNTVDELLRRHQSLNGGLAEQAALLKVTNQAREKEVTEEAKQAAKLAELERQLKSLNGGMAETIARTQQAVKARIKQIEADDKETTALKQLTAAEAAAQASNERATAALKAKNAVALEAARAIHRMTESEARNKAQAEVLIESTKRHNDRLLEAARASHGMSRAQKELNAERERSATLLAKLTAQKALSSSEDGRAITKLKEQIRAQERYNQVLAKSTLELLGFSGAQRRVSISLHAGSQSAAMLRAGLSGLQTSIGMYTSSTILMASATYAATAALRSAVVTGAEFTATMARANAVMNSASESWQPSGMAAMEAQVRALGATTSYTASEVAGGLVELGQAGLSATDAMLALKPALNMALIGNISMAESADIATNVMMMFHKESGDLTNVVDTMAVAVSRSNTNITQLANALTYAGPAAQSAGVSFEETVAAVAALSNNGIKASRAGTALRRLFVSIVNPTKKGAAVLDQYGVSVKDAEGKTKSLVDIIKQLNENIPEVDRLAAIQNLVGVYATSPIAALVGKPEEFEKQIRYMESVANAAEEMRKRIEDNLKFDWKQVTSSFEELKLTMFDNFEWLLRETSKSMTLWMNELRRPAMAFDMQGNSIELPNLDHSRITGSYNLQGQWEADKESLQAFREELERTSAIAEDSTNTVYSGLQKLIQEVKVMGTAVAYAAGGFLAFKAAGMAGGVFSALATDMGLVSTTVTILRDRLLAAAVAGSPLRASIAAAGAQLNAFGIQARLVTGGLVSLVRTQGASGLAMRTWSGTVALATAAMNAFTLQNAKAAVLGLMTGSVNLLAGAMTGLAWALKGVAIAGQVAMAALGWVGLIAGLYMAWETYKEVDPKKELENEAARAKELKDRYYQLAEAVDAYGKAQENAALRAQAKGAQEGLAALGERSLELASRESEARRMGISVDFSGERAYIADETVRYQKALEASHRALEAGVASMGDAASLSDRIYSKAMELSQAEESLKKTTQENIEAKGKYASAVAAAQNNVTRLKEELESLSQVSKQAGIDLLNAAAKLQNFRNGTQAALKADWLENNGTTSQKLFANSAALKETQDKIAKALDDNSDTSELAKRERGLLIERQGLVKDLADESRRYVESMEEASLIGKGDAERATALASKIANVRRELSTYEVNGKAPDVTSESGSAYMEKQIQLTGLLKEQESLRSSMAKSGEKLGKQDAKELEQAKTTYETLRKQYAPLAVSLEDLAKKEEQLALLVAGGIIKAEEKAKALAHLRKTHYELALSQDENYGALQKLREEYNASDSTLAKHAAEMASLNSLYEDGAVKASEYLRIKQKINEARTEGLLSGMPTAEAPSGEHLSTPVSEAMSVFAERANGAKWFDDRKEKLTEDWQGGYVRVNDTYLEKKRALDELKLEDEKEYQRRLTEIQAAANRQRTGLTKAYNKDNARLADERVEYEKQMAAVMTIAALGAAENLLSSYASVAEGATSSQRAAFAVMKALAIAQILVNTELAASKAMTMPDNPTFAQMMASNVAVRALGYASAGLVAATTIGQMSGGGEGNGSSYSGAYDDGGFIPYNSYGIVGEYGPEIVHGPANVTSRKESAKQLGSGGGEYNITLAPQISVTAGDSKSGSQPSSADMQGIATAVKNAVVSSLQEQMRPNGILDTWIRNKRG